MFSYIGDLVRAELLHPERLWLLVLPGVIFVACLITYRRQQWSALAIRLLSFSLLILALCDPVKHKTQVREELTAVFDVSASISKPGREALVSVLMPYLKEGRTLRLFPFGRQASSEPLELSGAESEERIVSALERASSAVDTGDTNIEAALQQMMQQTEAASVLLLTDGFETSGSARAAARAAESRGIRVFPLLPNQTPFESDKLAISSLYAPITVTSGDLVEVRASLKNNSNEEQAGLLELWEEDQKLYANRVLVPPGEERLVTAKTPPAKGGLHRLRAVLKAPESAAAAPSGRVLEESYRWISGKERSKVLLLSGTEDDQQVIRQLLSLKGYALESHVGDGRTRIPTEFAGFSLVILNNIARRQLPDTFLTKLKDFTGQGGGVILIGGDRSFGLGEYIKTPLEEISPVEFVPPQTTKQRINNAVFLVIDKSGSMRYAGKIDAAREAALLSIQTMKDDDYVGVIGFDSTPFVIIPLGLVKEVKPNAERRLRNLTPVGATNMLPGLSAARYELNSSAAGRKHVIVLSDGKVAGGTEDDCVEEVRRMQQAGITVSSVALGADADGAFLRMVSNYGHGAFYLTLDPRQLPQVFVHDIKVTTGEKTMREQSDFPVELGRSGLKTVTGISGFPALRGFVETIPKEGAALELVTSKEQKAFPILASWSYERGRVVAFTSDANGRWSISWLRWAGFPQFWSQAVESVKNRADEQSGEVDFDLRYSINQREILFDLAIYDPKLKHEGSPLISATVIEPGGESKQVSFRASKKGRFSAQLEHARPGDYRLNINYGKLKFPPLAVTISGEAFGETPGRGLNFPLVSDLAQISGGKINPSPSELRGYSKRSDDYNHLFVPILWAALCLVLIEAFVREIGVIGLQSWLRQSVTRSGNVERTRVLGSYEPRRRRMVS